MFVGDDRNGVALEVVVVAVGNKEGLVIHAMSLRDRYRQLYEEVRDAEEAS